MIFYDKIEGKYLEGELLEGYFFDKKVWVIKKVYSDFVLLSPLFEELKDLFFYSRYILLTPFYIKKNEEKIWKETIEELFEISKEGTEIFNYKNQKVK